MQLNSICIGYWIQLSAYILCSLQTLMTSLGVIFSGELILHRDNIWLFSMLTLDLASKTAILLSECSEDMRLMKNGSHIYSCDYRAGKSVIICARVHFSQ